MSLRMLKLTNGKTYAVISTSNPIVIPTTANYVGGDFLGVGGMTCLELPTDPTEMSLIWASLERGFHDINTEFHWVSAHIEYVLPQAPGAVSPNEVVDYWS